MYSSILSACIHGIDCRFVRVEADVSDGLPVFDIVGYLSAEVKEAKERVRTALRNSDFSLPVKRITVNISPAGVRKAGTQFDLAIAVAILSALGHISQELTKSCLFIGELGLNGEIIPVDGVLPIVMQARENGMEYVMLSKQNAREASLVDHISICPVSSISELLTLLSTGDFQKINQAEQCINIEEIESDYTDDIDFCEINGQYLLKRACEVAVSGMHHFLMEGPPGAGKTMIAKRIPTILPELSYEESLEISKVLSVAGKMRDVPSLMKTRPFRSPHHSITNAALVGGGGRVKPGEVTLAHCGVLFLDELTEFKRETLELLRQPLEDQFVEIVRVSGTYHYPANFVLVGACNPCPCGFYPDLNRCNCTHNQIIQYRSRLSGPLLDRMDLFVRAERICYEDLSKRERNETSAHIRKRVSEVHEIQKERYHNTKYRFNSQLAGKDIEKYCRLSRTLTKYMSEVYEKMELSARSYHKILKVARTIADMDHSKEIEKKHLLEAISYRKS